MSCARAYLAVCGKGHATLDERYGIGLDRGTAELTQVLASSRIDKEGQEWLNAFYRLKYQRIRSERKLRCSENCKKRKKNGSRKCTMRRDYTFVIKSGARENENRWLSRKPLDWLKGSINAANVTIETTSKTGEDEVDEVWSKKKRRNEKDTYFEPKISSMPAILRTLSNLESYSGRVVVQFSRIGCRNCFFSMTD
jgi:hypothetical protein